MHIVIAGGHGKIALLLSRQLADAGHHPVGLIRNRDHTAEVKAAGAEPRLLDLESSDLKQVTAALAGADAVVFAAGSGPDSGPERKMTVDRDGAILLADAAVAAGVFRMVVISSIGADTFSAASDDPFQVYLRAKSEADQAIRTKELAWTIVRPGSLTDEPATGLVAAASSVVRGSIPRADVAAVIVQLLADRGGVGVTFEVVSGDTPIAAAIASL